MANPKSIATEVSIPLIPTGRTLEDVDITTAYSHDDPSERANSFGTRSNANDKPHIPLNRALTTRNACTLALGLSWIVAFLSTICGAVLLAGKSRFSLQCSALRSGTIAAEIARLATISLTTALVESAGFVHAVSLRWSLLHERRLRFNSNLRLFSFSREVRANGWYSNFVMAVCTILAYASASLLVLGAEIMSDDTQERETVGWSTCAARLPTLVLGLSLLGVAAIGTWSLRAPNIMTWSSSPLDVALATAHLGHTQRRPGRCMMSIEDLQQPSVPTRPRAKQCSALKARKDVKYLLCLLLALEVACCIWIGVVANLLVQQGWGGWEWTFFPQYFSTFDVSPGTGSDGERVLKVFALYTGVQMPVTLGLHTAELVVNMSRDEMYWRRAGGEKGCTLKSYDSIVAAFTSWQSIVLYVFKALLHWTFSIAISPYVSSYFDGTSQGLSEQHKVIMKTFSLDLGLPQAVWFTLAFGIFTAAMVYIAWSRPVGPQPATYGHLQTLIDLIDAWSVTLYWGHKGQGEDGVAHAGTSDSRLLSIDMDSLYSGEKKAQPVLKIVE